MEVAYPRTDKNRTRPHVGSSDLGTARDTLEMQTHSVSFSVFDDLTQSLILNRDEDDLTRFTTYIESFDPTGRSEEISVTICELMVTKLGPAYTRGECD